MAKNNALNMYTRAKGVLKTLNVDQSVLAEKLGITQASVSLALNGKSEKTFLRIVGLLEKEYEVMPADIFDDPQMVNQGLQEQLAQLMIKLDERGQENAAIQAEIRHLSREIEELKAVLINKGK